MRPSSAFSPPPPLFPSTSKYFSDSIYLGDACSPRIARPPTAPPTPKSSSFVPSSSIYYLPPPHTHTHQYHLLYCPTSSLPPTTSSVVSSFSIYYRLPPLPPNTTNTSSSVVPPPSLYPLPHRPSFLPFLHVTIEPRSDRLSLFYLEVLIASRCVIPSIRS